MTISPRKGGETLSWDFKLGGKAMAQPLVSVLMGSVSDWEMMRYAVETLERLGIPYEVRVLSAHRTLDALIEYVVEAEGRGIQVFIAGAGGAAHLPGVIAAKTTLPVLGVPIATHALGGLDALLSIVQMPAGVPVGTLAIGRSGAINAALLAASILGLKDPDVRARLKAHRQSQAEDILKSQVPPR